MSYQVKNLGFTYEGSNSAIFSNINALLPQGEISLLVGASGAGKSTFIEVLMGIIPEYRAGRIEGEFYGPNFSWKDSTLKEMGLAIGLVFQNPESQFCSYTVAEELAFGLENLKIEREEMRRRVRETLSLLGILHLEYRPLHTLSGGEKQKVAIGSVLILDPPLLIFDEPTSNLDPKGMQEIFELIYRLKTERKKTILLIEHQLEFLIDKVDNLLVLGANGSLEYSGEVTSGLAMLSENNETGIHLPPSVRLDETANELVKRIGETRTSLEVPSASVMKNEVGDLVLSAKKMNLSLQGKSILRQVDLDIYSGEFVAIVGPNGAGKTSLLHALLGIYPETTGEIKLLRENIRKQRKKKWNYAGIAFQNPEWQFVADTVAEEILYSLKKEKITTAEKQQKVEVYLKRFGLWEKREMSPFVLSQGEKRRLSVAVILVREQRVLLLDEPTFGQDGNTQKQLMELISELNREGVTIIMVTHNMDLVYEYCQRVILLKEGKIAFDGSSERLFANEELCVQGCLIAPFWWRVSQHMGGHSETEE